MDSSQRILSEEFVFISELRKKPADFFKSDPVAVFSSNKLVGYTISPDHLEALMAIAEAMQNVADEPKGVKLNSGRVPVKGRFNPSAKEVKEIADRGLKALLDNAAHKNTEFQEI